MTEKSQHYDIIIVGAGLVGATLALLLAKQTSLSILIVDANAPKRFNQADSAYRPRVSAISLASKKLLEVAGVWQTIAAARVSPFQKIQVWDAAGSADITFDAQMIGLPMLGYIIENDLIQSALQQALLSLSNVRYLPETQLSHVAQDEYGVMMTASNGQCFKAPLAVAADGGQSWLRDHVGIALTKKAYDQQAIVTTVTTENAHLNVARQVFLPTGPLAFLPLKEPYCCSIVWSLSNEKVQAILEMNDGDFCHALTDAFSYRLGKVIACDARFAFPLVFQTAKHYVQDRVVLVGDAAHTMHPLAGQGVNVGFQDVACLSALLVAEHLAGKPIADARVLRRYQRSRKAENAGMLQGVNALNALFLSENKLVTQARSLGMQFTNHISWLKKCVMRFAVGK